MIYLQRAIFWPLVFICQLIATALLSWHLLALGHFAYPTGYKLLHLKEHIAQYAPLNRDKQGFEYTTPKEHWRLFGEISDAVEHQGKGLRSISYSLPNGTLVPLMHESEIIHLQDVSRLIHHFYQVGLTAAIVWLLLLVVAYKKRWPLPAPARVFGGFILGLIGLALVVFAAGPKHLFYWFHQQIFPHGHQWFFYYQESLMTTLMKAPDIFAFIAALLVSLLIILWLGGFWGMHKLLKGAPASTPSQPAKTRVKNSKRNKSSKQ